MTAIVTSALRIGPMVTIVICTRARRSVEDLTSLFNDIRTAENKPTAQPVFLHREADRTWFAGLTADLVWGPVVAFVAPEKFFEPAIYETFQSLYMNGRVERVAVYGAEDIVTSGAYRASVVRILSMSFH